LSTDDQDSRRASSEKILKKDGYRVVPPSPTASCKVDEEMRKKNEIHLAGDRSQDARGLSGLDVVGR